MSHMHLFLLLTLLLPTSAPAEDWPHWRGLNRDGTSTEDSGWERGAWPPREQWRTNVGVGSTSPLVAGGKVYVMGWAANTDRVMCLDADTGKELWRQSYRCRKYGRNAVGDQSLYGGPTSTPELDRETGYLFTLSTDGDLACWDTQQRGQKVWGTNLYESYRMPKRPKVRKSGQRDYGYTTAPVVAGDQLLVEVGGEAGTVVAFDKRTGRQRWASEARDLAGHTGGPVLMELEGVPCLVVLTHQGLLAMRLDKGHEGETVAHYPYQTDFANSIMSPAVCGNEVLISSGYNHRTMTKLRIGLGGASEVWKRKQIVSKVCTPVFLEGHAYWSWTYLHCLDVAAGKLLWKARSGGTDGSCIVTADQRLIVCTNRGEVYLVETAERSPDECQILSKVGRLFRREVWPHIALSNAKLYCKDRDGNLVCLPLVARQETAVAEPPSPKPVLRPSDPAAGRVVEWRVGMGATATDGLSLRPRGAARIDDNGALSVAGGAFLIDAANAPLLEQCRRSNELTVEVTLRTQTLKQIGPARIVSFSADPYHRNFTLGQQNSQLRFRLRTPRAGLNGMKPETTLCSIRANTTHHVIVTYRDGELVCYLDGRVAKQSDAVRGGFGNWEPMHLLVGDEFQDARDWNGTIAKVAVLSRFIGPEEARQRFERTPKGAAVETERPAEGPRRPEKPARSPRSELPASGVRLTEVADWQGQPSFRIDTPMGAFVYHRRGAGFASLIDRDGRDWIGFRPGGGSAGSYRGIPNLPIAKSGFHPGATTCETAVAESGPDRVVLSSRTGDGGWAGRWTITAQLAVLDLEKAAGAYWFLYEGTPGGKYDQTQAWMMDSSGRRQPCTARWERRLPDPRWICFGTGTCPRAIFLVDLTPRPEDVVDSFWSMQKNMTVFGFGRQLSKKNGRWFHLRRVPARFAVGSVEEAEHAAIAQHVERVCEGL